MNSPSKELVRKEAKNNTDSIKEDETVTLDQHYLDQSFGLLRDALQKGMDVAQMENGDLMITETKTVTYRYRWDNERKRFERHNSMLRKPRKAKVSA